MKCQWYNIQLETKRVDTVFYFTVLQPTGENRKVNILNFRKLQRWTERVRKEVSV